MAVGIFLDSQLSNSRPAKYTIFLFILHSFSSLTRQLQIISVTVQRSRVILEQETAEAPALFRFLFAQNKSVLAIIPSLTVRRK